MTKKISQREARGMRAELEERRREQSKIVKDAMEWKATAERLLKTHEALEARVNRGVLLERGKKIAEWRDFPESVREAIAVAEHLGYVCAFKVERRNAYSTTAPMFPETVESLVVEAYQRGKAE
jgi:hypothetical protein